MTTRRHFLQLSAMSMLSACLPGSGKQEQPVVKRRMAVQLYTVREQLRKDFKGTLQRLRDIGFTYVETAFWPEGIRREEAALLLQDHDLQVCACHVELPIGDGRQAFLDTARAFHCNNLIWHGWPEDQRYQSMEGTMQLVDLYNDAHRMAKDNGCSFGLHNHWWEYRNKLGNKYIYEILAETLHPDIFFEMDAYWVKVAGHDPAEIARKLGSRLRLMHVKDGPAVYHEQLATDNPDPMTAVGKGTQDFPAIFKAADPSCEWLVVEMDKTAGDVLEALEESVRFLKPFTIA